jgi:membrane protein
MSPERHRTLTGPYPESSGRGRNADRPEAIPPRGFRDVLMRVKRELQNDDIAMMAAGMAFYAMLAVFPGLIALVTLYGLVASPADVEQQLTTVAGHLPPDARELLREQMEAIVSSSDSALGLGLVVALVVALWTASNGAVGMIKAVNRAYDEAPRRNFIQLRLLGMAFTLGAIAVAATAIFLLAVLPAFFDQIGLAQTGRTIVEIVRWVGLAVLVVLGLGLVYRYAPDRTRPRFRWVSWGAIIATVVWLGATALFTLYVSHFGNYQGTYGALGGVIILLLWLFLSSFSVLLGAEINSELEAQTAKDSTVGKPAPMGQRGATKADFLGEAHPR